MSDRGSLGGEVNWLNVILLAVLVGAAFAFVWRYER